MKQSSYAWTIAFVVCLIYASSGHCQTTEMYAGDKRAGVDILWLKRFQKAGENQSPWLFFSRNRASSDYENNTALFGSTNAVSYNFKSGLGLVGVGTFSMAGFRPKAGVQYFTQQKDLLFFGWLVMETARDPALELFALLRYQPPVAGEWRFFLQAELFPAWTTTTGYKHLTERLRVGLKYRSWAGGFMLDLNQSGTETFVTSTNTGVFLRYDF